MTGKKLKAVDAYIARANDFARPILLHLRDLVHRGCPEVEEAMKWGFPHFMHNGILCSMAAFKGHCAFGFWKGKLLFAGEPSARSKAEEAMGHFGRITSLADLPAPQLLLKYVRAAARLNVEGIKLSSQPRPRARSELVIPDYFSAALANNRLAREAFEQFPYSHKKEYLEWVTEAKREETRSRRLQTAVEWLAQGKPRNWKYAGC
jgi:uncharacterized protein YdeI (YjbR/CyaY-like superfamily)